MRFKGSEISFEPHIVFRGVGREGILLHVKAPKFCRDARDVDSDETVSWLCVLLDDSARLVDSKIEEYLRREITAAFVS